MVKTPIFNLLAHLPKIKKSRQRCVDDKTRGMSYLLANLGPMNLKSVCRQIGVVHPGNSSL